MTCPALRQIAMRHILETDAPSPMQEDALVALHGEWTDEEARLIEEAIERAEQYAETALPLGVIVPWICIRQEFNRFVYFLATRHGLNYVLKARSAAELADRIRETGPALAQHGL